MKNNITIDFERLKQELHESDFDGHTEFHNLTFTQKGGGTPNHLRAWQRMW